LTDNLLIDTIVLMQHCGQHYPYAGKTSPCSGTVHDVTIRREPNGINPVVMQPESAGTVCDGHMQSFIELGHRETYRFSIISKKSVGVIDEPQTIEKQAVKREKE